jgi:hypothetical protein
MVFAEPGSSLTALRVELKCFQPLRRNVTFAAS